MNSRADFYLAHKKLISKAIEELHFDEVLTIEGECNNWFLIATNNTTYKFKGKIGPWGHIQIDTETLTKVKNKRTVVDFTISSFFKELQSICSIDDQTLVQYLEEANQTIFSDLKIIENHKVLSFKNLSYQLIDQQLPGHTKLIMNKGRIGWGQKEIEKYAPEYQANFQLIWLAIKKDLLIIGIENEISPEELIPMEVLTKLKEMNIGEGYLIVPVHPWQWEHYIHNQFLENIINEDIIPVSTEGDTYSAQSSIRTLTNITCVKSFDVKLAISILNTSCVRGIPGKYIEDGHKLSSFFESLIEGDSYLNSKVDILKEVAAVKLKHKYFDDVQDCSYRFKELFGSVWRESVASKITDCELAIPCAGLLIENSDESLIGFLIKESGISASDWVRNYLKVVVLPLYYLQLKHGVGVVAHGQNIILVLEKSMPKRLIIKDFHGDLRLSTDSIHLGNKDVNVLDRLPPHHLLHDLLTGHFVTVIRYISRLMSDAKLMSENTFYEIAWQEINHFNIEHKVIKDEVNLLKSKFEKILVNKVRFIAGYSETNTRLKPCLGSDIQNPLKEYIEETNE